MARISKKQVALSLLMLLVMGLTAYAAASDIVGDVQVEEKLFHIENLQAPTTVDPGQDYLFNWTLRFSDGITDTANGGMDYLYIDYYHSSVLVTDPYGPLHFHAAYKTSTDDRWVFVSSGWLVSTLPLNSTSSAFLTTTTEYMFQTGVHFNETALYGTWTMEVRVHIPSDGPTLMSETTTFQVNSYSSLVIQESSFSWGTVEAGQFEVPITDPTSGYLSMDIVVNNGYTLQVSGTNPSDGGSNSFAVSNIMVWDSDAVGSAQALSITPTDLGSLSFDDEVTTIHIYIWIDIPSDQTPATYTTTLTFVLTPV